MSLDPSVLPTELLTVPQPLIGFTGLDIAKNAIHKSIWEAFNNNRKTERAPIQFKLLNQNYDLPVSKPKRTSFEWYHPRGVLKRNWMLKHLHVLPSVVVLFQDIEWNDPEWTKKQMHCASLVQSLKNSLQGRNTRLAVVLLQGTASLPPGEDLLATDRAANLTSNCDINSKMLFVLPYNDHLSGYTLRLESALVELAQSYYAQMAKQVRLHRDQLTPAHQNLRVRHQFKLGFIAEMRQDFNTALKHYAQGYLHLDEIRVVDTNCLEIKTVAGYFNYKICRLMFKLNAPRDAINQFRTHVDRYKGRPGFKELSFEHYAWLSVQYSAFAELFCEAIKNGLPALQTQHPGIYFHKASEYIARRKEAFLQCSSLSLSPQEPTPPQHANVLYSEFYGIRGTKTGEPISEQQIIAIVQDTEKLFNHSAATVALLSQAMAQFKIYKCLRFRKKLAIDMAEEYLRSGDHSNALTLYSLMLSDYRTDQWFTIFTEVLLKTLRSAFLSASVTDFVCCSIEALSPKIHIDKKERVVVLENLWKVFQGVPPISHTQIAPELKTVWDAKLVNSKSPVYIDLDNITGIIDCVVSFERPQLKNEEQIRLELYMRSKSEVPLKLNNISVLLTDSKSNYKLDVSQFKVIEIENVLNLAKSPKAATETSDWLDFDSNFLLEADNCYKFLIVGGQFQFKENSELRILRLEIKMGTDNICAILTQSNALNRTKEFRCFNPALDCMQHIPVFSTCYITPTFHLTVQNDFENQPMIVNEYFRVTCNLSNTFDLALQNVGLSITISNSFRKNVFLAPEMLGDCQKLQTQIQIDIGDLQPHATTSISYYVTSFVEGNIELTQKSFYQTASNEADPSLNSNVISMSTVVDSPTLSSITSGIATLGLNSTQQSHNIIVETVDNAMLRKSKEDTIIIPCNNDFKLTAGFYSMSRDPLAFAYDNEEILLRINMEVRTHCPIEIIEANFISNENIVEKLSHKKRLKFPIACKFGQQIEDVRLLHISNTPAEWVGDGPEFRKFKKPILHASDYVGVMGTKTDDAFNKNLLNKIPMNSSIVRSIGDLDNATKNTSQLSVSVSDDLKDNKENENKKIASKLVYNCTTNAFVKSKRRGGRHLKGRITEVSDQEQHNMDHNFGVYYIRWRRVGSLQESESKFAINGMDVIPAPLNMYCYVEEKMYVKVPMLLKITIKNPSHKILHLVANLSNSDNFMFAGHKQINISIFSNSEFVVIVNLYPLKAGWQTLPELTLEYSTHEMFGELMTESMPQQRQHELNNLVKRWMPKRVFILPPFLE